MQTTTNSASHFIPPMQGKVSALNIIQASIQPVDAEPDLKATLSVLQRDNEVTAVIALYDAFVRSAEAFDAVINQPRAADAYDCLEVYSEQARAKSYLCADALKSMRANHHEAARYAETLFSCALQMGNNLPEAAAALTEIVRVNKAQR